MRMMIFRTRRSGGAEVQQICASLQLTATPPQPEHPFRS